MDKPNYYAIIPASIRYNKNICANAKLLYGEITALSNKEGFCWASNSYFAEIYNVSVVSISTWINELVKEDFIYTNINKQKGNTRQIFLKEVINKTLIPNKENFNTPNKENFKSLIRSNTTSNNTTLNMENLATFENQKSIIFNELWTKYPNKDGKKQAIRHFNASVKNEKDFEDIKLALNNYINSPQVKKGFIKNGSTWFCNWRDWIDFKGINPIQDKAPNRISAPEGKYANL